IVGSESHIKTIAKIYFKPVMIAYAAALPHLARTDPTAVVLHAAADIVRRTHVVINMIKLRYRQIFHKSPGLSAVVRNIQTAVVALDDVVGILRVNPHGVVIGVHAAEVVKIQQILPG